MEQDRRIVDEVHNLIEAVQQSRKWIEIVGICTVGTYMVFLLTVFTLFYSAAFDAPSRLLTLMIACFPLGILSLSLGIHMLRVVSRWNQKYHSAWWLDGTACRFCGVMVPSATRICPNCGAMR
jgi:uncharacterized membrane protein